MVDNMRNKNKLVKWYMCSLTDLDSLKMYLEEMALKGWMLEKLGSMRLIFGRYQPQKIIYTVETYPKTSYDDMGVTSRNQEFVDMCEAGGWHFIASYECIHIFFTIDENITPIQTDLHIKLKAINKSEMKQNRNIIFQPLILSIIWLSFSYREYLNSIHFSYGTDWSYAIILWGLIFFTSVALLVIHAIWYINASKTLIREAKIPEKRGFVLVSFLIISLISALFIIVSILASSIQYVIVFLACIAFTTGFCLINQKTQKLIKTKMRTYCYAMVFFYIAAVGLLVIGIVDLIDL